MGLKPRNLYCRDFQMEKDMKDNGVSIMLNILYGYAHHIQELTDCEVKTFEQTGEIYLERIESNLKAMSIIISSIKRIVEICENLDKKMPTHIT